MLAKRTGWILDKSAERSDFLNCSKVMLTVLGYGHFRHCSGLRSLAHAGDLAVRSRTRLLSRLMTEAENGVYLITGGLGGVGLTLAGHLAKRGKSTCPRPLSRLLSNPANRALAISLHESMTYFW